MSEENNAVEYCSALSKLRDFYRWRKYPDEKPEKDGVYLVYNGIDAYKPKEIMRYIGGKWMEEEYDDFRGCEQPDPERWTNIPLLPEEE